MSARAFDLCWTVALWIASAFLALAIAAFFLVVGLVDLARHPVRFAGWFLQEYGRALLVGLILGLGLRYLAP